MTGRLRLPRRLLAAGILGTAGLAAFAPAAHAQGGYTSSSGNQVVGETVTAQAIAAQFAFNIPGVAPLPNTNLIEEDLPFARSIVSTGPTVQSIGAPYYPGDILANLGGLESEFVPELPNTPYPFLAEAEYPATPQYGASATFGGGQLSSKVPASSPVVPTGLSGTADASANGGSANGTLSDLVVGPGMGSGGAPLLEVASEQADDAVNIGTALVSATASSVVKSIDVAGMVDISELDSEASSTSDGTTGTPKAVVQVGQVTVDGYQADIDDQGVHVVGTNPAPNGIPTPSQVQNSLNQTLSQDGITIRLLDPKETANGAEGIANTGGLVISLSHQFNVPFVNTGALTNNALQPCIPTQDVGELPIPGLEGQTLLGNVCLPAGTYTAIASLTLGLATTDVNASSLQTISVPGTSLPSTPLQSLGTAPLSPLGGQTNLGTTTGPGTVSPAGTRAIGPGLLKFPIRGLPPPLQWVVIGLILCVIFAYPMMLMARWQFLVGRR
jgi:hypothetical protein